MLPCFFMFWRLLKPVLILPGTVLVFVPAVILFACRTTPYSHKLADPGHLFFWLGLVAAATGIILAVWTVTLFITYGQGTPAPWDPPQKLLILGPYRYVRNPMITSVLFMLLSETLLLQSWPIFFWMFFFYLANAFYFPLFEERSLEKKIRQGLPGIQKPCSPLDSPPYILESS